MLVNHCDQCLDFNEKARYTDDDLKIIISGIVEIEKTPVLETKVRNEVLKRIKKETGASIKQLEKVLGIGRNMIQKA